MNRGDNAMRAVEYGGEPSLYGFDNSEKTYAVFGETWGAEPGDQMTVATERRSWSGTVYEATARYTTVRTNDDFETAERAQYDYLTGAS